MRSITTLRKKFLILIIYMMISVIILSGTLITPVAAAVTTVKVDPSSQTVSIGSTFTVNILCVPVQSIKSYELKVVFNPSLLKANSVSKGNIFKSYTTFFNAGTIDNVGGTINNIYDLILGIGSTSSSGTLITISFTAKSTSGTSSIYLKNVGITNNVGYLPVTIINGSVKISVQTQPSNEPPVYETMFPANKSSNIPISTTSLSLTIRDPDGDHFNYTIQTRPNVGSVSVKNMVNGTKSCTISGLKYATTYRWYVNATDGVNWKRCWYTFTTAQNPVNNPFIFSAVNPSNGSTNIPISTSTITITIKNSKGHAFSYYIKTNPKIGSSSGANKVNGSKTCSVSGLTYGTTYQWYVSCRDVSNGQWTNQSYWFTTESNPADSSPPSGGGGGTSSNDTEPPPSIPEHNNPPNPPTNPTGPTFIERGVNYYYISSAFDPDNDTIRLRFDWGDGTYSNWTGFVPANTTVSLSHTWRNASSYNISVIAQDENGTNSSWSNTLTVTISQAELEEEQANVEIITASNNISINETVQFNASSVVPDDAIVSYYWNLGDGKTSTGKTAVHTYTTPGQYTVTLSITNNLGETYNKKINITVTAGAEELAQYTTNFISLNLTIIIIGTVIAIIFILILFARKKINLQLFKKYIAPGQKWIKQLIIKIAESKQSISRKPKPIVKLTNVQENKAMNTLLDYAPTENNVKKIDDIELASIHEKIDKIIMKY